MTSLDGEPVALGGGYGGGGGGNGTSGIVGGSQMPTQIPIITATGMVSASSGNSSSMPVFNLGGTSSTMSAYVPTTSSQVSSALVNTDSGVAPSGGSVGNTAGSKISKSINSQSQPSLKVTPSGSNLLINGGTSVAACAVPPLLVGQQVFFIIFILNFRSLLIISTLKAILNL